MMMYPAAHDNPISPPGGSPPGSQREQFGDFDATSYADTAHTTPQVTAASLNLRGARGAGVGTNSANAPYDTGDPSVPSRGQWGGGGGYGGGQGSGGDAAPAAGTMMWTPEYVAQLQQKQRQEAAQPSQMQQQDPHQRGFHPPGGEQQQQQTPSYQQQAQQQQMGHESSLVPAAQTTFPRFCIIALEVFKIGDFGTDLFKLLCNAPACRHYWEWVCFSLCMAFFILVMKVVDQMSLLMVSARWKTGSIGCIGFLFFPITLCVGPFTAFNFFLYKSTKPDPIEQDIFLHRPLSSILMGLPGYSLLSAIVADGALIFHPFQAHLRAVQGLYQNMLQDLPSICIDLAVIINRPPNEDVSFFAISLAYSSAMLLIVNGMSVLEADNSERARCHREAIKSGGNPKA